MNAASFCAIFVRRNQFPTILLIVVWVLFFIAAKTLPIVPDAMPVVGAINGSIGILLAGLVFVKMRSVAIQGGRHRNLFAGIILAVIFLLSYTSTMMLIFEVGLAGEDRVETIIDRHSRKTVYVYEAGGIPDGFISARVAMKYKNLPFEKTIAILDAPFQRAEQNSGSVELWFGRAGLVRIDMASGLIERVETEID